MTQYHEELDRDHRPHRAGADTEHSTFEEVVKKASIRTEYETTGEMIVRVIDETSVRDWAKGLAFGLGVIVMLYIMMA